MADTVTVDHDGVEHETELAKLFKFADGNEWIPISAIKDEGEDWIEIPARLARDKELV